MTFNAPGCKEILIELFFSILFFKIYSDENWHLKLVFCDLKSTSISPLKFEPKNSSSLITPWKIFFSLESGLIFISSGLIVIVTEFSLIVSLHSRIDP